MEDIVVDWESWDNGMKSEGEQGFGRCALDFCKDDML